MAGWRRQRIPELPDVVHFTLAPDWLCEVLSPSTEQVDRSKKLRLYAGAGIGHVWLANPLVKSLEVYHLAGEFYSLIATHGGDDRVRAEPFAELELELAALWAR